MDDETLPAAEDDAENPSIDDALQPASEAALLEEEREKHARRAAKFGVEYREPEKRRDLRHVVRKERALERASQRGAGFATGIDIFSEEEVARRRDRAARFGTEDTLAGYQPAVDPLEAARRKKRADKFGTEYKEEDAAGLMDVDLLEQKREVPAEVPRRQDAIHLYGVDLLNTKEVLAYFGEYGPVYVDWLDDSSCNVLFEQFKAKRAIFGMGKPLPPEDVPAGQELASVDVTQMERLWHKGPDFEKAGAATPLIFRLATVEDKRPAPGTHTSRRLWQDPAAVQGDRHRRPPRGDRSGGTGGAGSPRLHPIAEEGASRGRRRKRRADGDVEMYGADIYHGDLEDETRDLKQQRSREAGDRRSQRRGRPQVAGLFSAAAAGIALPARAARHAPEEEMAIDGDAEEADAAPQRTAVSYADL